jgi:hypothetical protein
MALGHLATYFSSQRRTSLPISLHLQLDHPASSLLPAPRHRLSLAMVFPSPSPCSSSVLPCARARSTVRHRALPRACSRCFPWLAQARGPSMARSFPAGARISHRARLVEVSSITERPAELHVHASCALASAAADSAIKFMSALCSVCFTVGNFSTFQFRDACLVCARSSSIGFRRVRVYRRVVEPVIPCSTPTSLARSRLQSKVVVVLCIVKNPKRRVKTKLAA